MRRATVRPCNAISAFVDTQVRNVVLVMPIETVKAPVGVRRRQFSVSGGRENPSHIVCYFDNLRIVH